MIEIKKIQAFLRSSGIDGWLFTDHHGRDPVARELLGERVAKHVTRRWFYFIPQRGDPRKLVHKIEALRLTELPGETTSYSRWQEQRNGLENLLSGSKRIAMQYAEDGALLLLSNVDAGIVDLVRSFGVEVVSSGDLLQRLVAALSPEQIEMHLEAGKRVDRIREEAFELLRTKSVLPREWELKNFISDRFRDLGLTAEDGPIVAAGPNSGDPHYEPSVGSDREIQAGDIVLLDMWAKLEGEPLSPYYDITWVASIGAPKDERAEKVFQIVARARDAAIAFVEGAVADGTRVAGYEVDRVARKEIERAGFGDFFLHRTGHSIDTSVHGLGANMDDFESHETRTIVNGSCFSIEPGIYLPEFGVRLEVDMIVDGGRAFVTGAKQEALIVVGRS